MIFWPYTSIDLFAFCYYHLVTDMVLPWRLLENSLLFLLL
jgi:hypothetical protein